MVTPRVSSVTRASHAGSPHQGVAGFEVLDQLGQGLHLEGVLGHEVAGALEELALEARQLVRQVFGQRHRRQRALLIPPRMQPIGEGDLTRLDVAGTHLQAQGHALQLPVVELVARPVVAPVDVQAHAHSPHSGLPGLDERIHPRPALVVTVDGHHHDLDGRHLGRQDQPSVVAVAHDHPAHHPGRNAPGGGVA